MLKLSAHLSEKRPLPQVDFSSRQCGASMEVELADGAPPETVQDKLKELYALLQESIDGQFRQEREAPPVRASPAQIRAISAIARDRGLAPDELCSILRADYEVERAEELSLRQASDLIGKFNTIGAQP